MLKAMAPKVAPAVKVPDASVHLWEDFIRQVGSYARKVDAVHGGKVGERRRKTVETKTWYNNTKPEVIQMY